MVHYLSRTLLPLFILSANMLLALPIITSLSPFVGPESGGTLVTIIGSGFTGTTALNFGDEPVLFSVSSDTLLLATSPGHAPGVVTVSVTAPSGTSVVSNDSYFAYQGNWQAYVTTVNADTSEFVNVIDVATQTHTNTLTAGYTPSNIGITPYATETYILNLDSNDVTVIDTLTNTVVATTSVGTAPNSVAFSPDGTLAYVLSADDDLFFVIDIATSTVIDTVPTGGRPSVIAITSDGTKGYVANFDDGTVSIFDLTTYTVTNTVDVGEGPVAIAITPNQATAYVTNFNDDTVSVIDVASDTVVATISVGSTPGSIAITPNSAKAYVINSGTINNISVINTATNTVTATIGVNEPKTLLITPDGLNVYVGTDTENMAVISTTSDTVITTIPLGFVSAMAITPDGKQIYVAYSEKVSVIDTVSNVVVNTIGIAGHPPFPVAITADQTPLAKFTIGLTRELNVPVNFDASQSVSPTGTIVNYFWDFGDGNTLNTTSPLTSHIYTVQGDYTVTLTVTNSAGTSNTQLYNFSSNVVDFGGIYYHTSIPMTNNGGPPATTNRLLTFAIPGPVRFTGCVKKNKFLNKTEYVLRATWTPLTFPGIVAYRIYQDGTLRGTVLASAPLFFSTCVDSKSSAQDFSIVAVDAEGQESLRTPIVIEKISCCK